jgi:hypothetical protein
LEEEDFMLQPFNNSTETDSTAGGQNLESDQNRESTNSGNIDVDVDISLTFDFLETVNGFPITVRPVHSLWLHLIGQDNQVY